jgi:hypothetical protein
MSPTIQDTRRTEILIRFMKKNGPPMFYSVPTHGHQFLRINESGEIVRNRGFDDKNLEYTVEGSDGKQSQIHGSKVSNDVTPEEERDFLNNRPDTD